MYERARPYDEPGVVQILIQSSFFCTLNLVNHVLDRWIYCGLLGQLFIGVAWGAPGAQWLSQAMQQVFTQLGYLGLILLVYEGVKPSLPDTATSTAHSAMPQVVLLPLFRH